MKYEFKGTKGEWKANHISGLGQHWYSVTDDNGEETQDIYWVVGLHDTTTNFESKHIERLSNIHLCAAAPDLLQACIEALSTVSDMGYPDGATACTLREAIHKALNINE